MSYQDRGWGGWGDWAGFGDFGVRVVDLIRVDRGVGGGWIG